MIWVSINKLALICSKISSFGVHTWFNCFACIVDFQFNFSVLNNTKLTFFWQEDIVIHYYFKGPTISVWTWPSVFENRFIIVQKNHSRKRKVFEEVKQLMVSTSIPILDRDNPVNCNSPTDLNQVYSQLLWSRLVYKRHKTARCKPRLKIWHLLISLFSLFSLFSHLCCVPLPLENQ